jgi:hypothetical protein
MDQSASHSDPEIIMQPVPIHIAPFLVAVLVKIIVGSLWYSPLLFLRPWKELAGVTDASPKHSMPMAYTIWIVGALVMTFVLAHAVFYAQARAVATGAAVGFFNWLGFIFVTQMDTYAAEKKPFKLVAINAGHHLVALLIMGAILAAWS